MMADDKPAYVHPRVSIREVAEWPDPRFLWTLDASDVQHAIRALIAAGDALAADVLPTLSYDEPFDQPRPSVLAWQALTAPPSPEATP